LKAYRRLRNFQLAEAFKSDSKTKLEVGFQATEKFKLAEELQSGTKTKL
jgi:hypothetical protein